MQLQASGYFPQRETFAIDGKRFDCADQQVSNIIAELPGCGTQRDEIIVIGAHYDSRGAFPHWHDHSPVQPDGKGTPGANDNASGVAAVLAIAQQMAHQQPARTIRFCLWVNEEPPFYQSRDTDAMGSYVSARRSREHAEKIISVIAFDCVGCFSPQPRTKRHSMLGPLPAWLGLPDTHDYIAFATTHPHGALAKACATTFAKHSTLPVRTLALPYFSKKVAWSDDWSYTRFRYPAVCITDTAFLRADHYHELPDTADKLDYKPFAEVVMATSAMLSSLAIAKP